MPPSFASPSTASGWRRRTLFVDDNQANVAGAAAVGLIALHFTDEAALRRDLKGLGLLA